MPNNGWTDKKDVVYMYTIEYYLAIKKGNTAIYDNMNGPWGC